MLTAAQHLARQRFIGASEVAAVLGLDKYKSPLDVWQTKALGPDGEVPPILVEAPADIDNPARFATTAELSPKTAPPILVGSIFERAVVELYELVSGATAVRCESVIHPLHSWAAATPDRLCVARTQGGVVERSDIGVILRYIGDKPPSYHGLECKLVGHFMKDEWQAHSIPERVWIQAQWGMACTTLERWDVAAVISGSTFVVHPVARDERFIEDAVLAVGDWWERHVIGMERPERRSAGDLHRYLTRRWPTPEAPKVDVTKNPTLAKSVMPLLERHIELSRRKKELEAEDREVVTALEAICGPTAGLKTGLGTFSFATVRGAVDWKEVSSFLNGGEPVEVDLADMFRRDGRRNGQFHAFKEKKNK